MIVVTPCGSAKFRTLIQDTVKALQEVGFVVLAPTLLDMGFATKLEGPEALLAWKGGTYSHFQRIRRCNVCLVCNPGGYSGASTTLEIGYAAAMGKLMVACRNDVELARQSLYDYVLDCEEPAEIAAKLSMLLRLGTASSLADCLGEFEVRRSKERRGS